MIEIYCCGCEQKVTTIKKKGSEVYPHRSDLKHKTFFACTECNCFVGENTSTGEPLGVIPTKEISSFRQTIHQLIDPLWKDGKISRSKLYSLISEKIGYDYHTADLKSLEECKMIIKIAIELRGKLYGYRK